MKSVKVYLVLLLLSGVAVAQQPKLNWYSFDRDFINDQYSDSAIGELRAKAAFAAKNVHAESCGGKDAELHIGITLDKVDLPAGQMPLSGPLVAGDAAWGVVAELPNADLADGPSKFKKLSGKPVTFEGYFRVWDEGHANDTFFPSNPHHVFEVHPAWGFRGQGVSFSRRDLVAPMDSYSGYGASKFRPMLAAISAGKWPKAYRDGGRLFVGLAEASNFFQLPVVVRGKEAVTGGHEVTLDVYSDAKHKNLVYKGLTGITAEGSPIDGTIKAGQKTFLLGLFSVNLKKALAGAGGADSKAGAVAVKEALEFFVFGVAVNSAVKGCG